MTENPQAEVVLHRSRTDKANNPTADRLPPPQGAIPCNSDKNAEVRRLITQDTTFEGRLGETDLWMITVFSARLHGSRSRKNQKLLDGACGCRGLSQSMIARSQH